MQHKAFSYRTDLDQSIAKELNKQGSTILLLDVPQGTIIGIDKQKHICGPKFKGWKMIPPGVHVISLASGGDQGAFFTSSIFVCLGSGEVLVRRWNVSLEMLEHLDNDEADRYAKGAARFEFDDGLAPYNWHAYQEWVALTTFIETTTISRLSPLNGAFICVIAEAGPGEAMSAGLEEQLGKVSISGTAEPQVESNQISAGPPRHAPKDLPTASASVGRCYYTYLPRLVKPQGIAAGELTAANLDKSGLLEEVIAQNYSAQPDRLLGELQFAFLAFLIGQSLEGFQQWKAILHLMLGCEAAPLHQRSLLYAKLLSIIEVQLKSSLSDLERGTRNSADAAATSMLMTEDLLDSSFLKHLLKQLFDTLDEAAHPLEPALQEAERSLKDFLQKGLDWNFSLQDLEQFASDDEFAPVVVDL